MNITTRIKNNIKYAYYRKLRDKAIAKAEEHIHDVDPTEFKKWSNIAVDCIRVCISTPLG